jgi:hypothetical protein
MKETLVSLETAKLLKEKGFDWKVIHHYRGNDLLHNGIFYNFNCPKEQELWNIELTSACTLSLAQQWLREVHNIHIWIIPISLTNYEYYYFKGTGYTYSKYDDYKTYEQALEAGIIAGLKLINND